MNGSAALSRQNPATAHTCRAATCVLHCITHKLAAAKEADRAPFRFSFCSLQKAAIKHDAVGNSAGTSDGIKPLTDKPTQNSATRLRSGDLHRIRHQLLFCSKDSRCRKNDSFSRLGKNLNVQFPLQSNTSAFRMPQLLFLTIRYLHLGLAFLDPRGIIQTLKMLTMWFCSAGSPHFSLTLGMDIGASSHLQAGQDFMGIGLNEHRKRSYLQLRASTVQADPR